MVNENSCEVCSKEWKVKNVAGTFSGVSESTGEDLYCAMSIWLCEEHSELLDELENDGDRFYKLLER